MLTNDTSIWEVILVEDQGDLAEVLAKILRHRNIRVHMTSSAQECLKLLERVTPTLIITDLAMPGMDGWGMLDALRSERATANIPVVAVTAYHSPEVADTAVKVGFNAYFPKPIDAGSFVSRLVEIFAVAAP